MYTCIRFGLVHVPQDSKIHTRLCVCVCVCVCLCVCVQENQNSWPFLEPVSEDQAPEYYKLIKFPMGKVSLCIKKIFIIDRSITLSFRFTDGDGATTL